MFWGAHACRVLAIASLCFGPLDPLAALRKGRFVSAGRRCNGRKATASFQTRTPEARSPQKAVRDLVEVRAGFALSLGDVTRF